MNKYDNFLKVAARELNIWQGTDESEESWKARVIYSILGRMFLASMWNKDDDDQPVSKIYTRRHFEKLLRAYHALYPEASELLPEETGKLLENLYLNAGFVYNLPERFAPAVEKALRVDGISLLRGCAMAEHSVWMSGLGLYRPARALDGEADVNGVGRMYQFQEQTLDGFRQDLTQDVTWSKMEEEHKAEYLRLSPPFTRGYWTDEPDKSGKVSIMRFGEPSALYYLYRFEDDRLVGHPLPEWRTARGEYRRIAVSFLRERGTLPPIKYWIDGVGKAVEVRLGYLLPPAELNFFELYSWPCGFRSSGRAFNRLMAYSVFFQAFKPALEKMGYCFEEMEEKFDARS